MPADLKELMLGCLRPVESQRMEVKDIANSAYIKRVQMESQVEKKEEKDEKESVPTFYSSTHTLSTKTYLP